MSLWAELGQPVQIGSASVPLLQLIVIVAVGVILSGLAMMVILILIFRPAGLMAGREVMLPARWVARSDATGTEPTQSTGETPSND